MWYLFTTGQIILKCVESEEGNVYGNDCMVANLVPQLNKLRYKDGKGDPRGFNAFLHSHNQQRGSVPSYRRNRLHILFHICGKYVEQYDAVLTFPNSATVAYGDYKTSRWLLLRCKCSAYLKSYLQGHG